MEPSSSISESCDSYHLHIITETAAPDESGTTLCNDIKPSVAELERKKYDDGIKTPPLPRSGSPLMPYDEEYEGVYHPSSYKTPERQQNKRIPSPPEQFWMNYMTDKSITEGLPQLDSDNEGSFSSLLPECPSSKKKTNSENDNMDMLIAMKRIGSLENILENTRSNLQKQQNQGICAVRMLNTGFHELHKNIKEMMGLKNLDSIDPEWVTSASPPQNGCCKCVEKQTQEAETNTCNLENSSTATAVPVLDTNRLEEKLECLERSANDNFMKLETRRLAMLREIKKTNEALSKLLTRQDSADDLIFALENEDAGVFLPVQELNLQQEWTETEEEFLIEDNDYDAWVFQHQTANALTERENNEMSIFCTPPKNLNGKILSAELESPNYSDDSMTPSTPPTSSTDFHQRDENSPNRVCKCGANFKSNGALWSHIIHSNPPRLKCDHCENMFRKSNELANHLSHQHNITTVGRFRCYKCNQTFVSRGDASKHRSTCPLLPKKVGTTSAKKKARTALSDSDSCTPET